MLILMLIMMREVLKSNVLSWSFLVAAVLVLAILLGVVVAVFVSSDGLWILRPLKSGWRDVGIIDRNGMLNTNGVSSTSTTTSISSIVASNEISIPFVRLLGRVRSQNRWYCPSWRRTCWPCWRRPHRYSFYRTFVLNVECTVANYY